MDKIQANVILEILGRPKEHIVSALKELVKRLSTEKGVVIKEQKIHDPIELKDSKDIFTTFAEVNIEFESLGMVYAVMFAYMPANVEIYYPEKITFKNEDLNAIANRLLQKLHDYDAIVKRTIMDRDRLLEKLKEVAPDLFAKKPLPQEEKSSKKRKSKKSKG